MTFGCIVQVGLADSEHVPDSVDRASTVNEKTVQLFPEIPATTGMLAAELVAPRIGQRPSHSRRLISIGVFATLGALAVLALVTTNQTPNKASELLWDATTSGTGKAAAIRGSISTADQEATAIMSTNGAHFDEDMGVPYTRGVEPKGSFDQTAVLDCPIATLETCSPSQPSLRRNHPGPTLRLGPFPRGRGLSSPSL